MIRYFYEDDDLDDQIYSLGRTHFSGVIVLAAEMEEATLSRFDRLEIPLVFLDAYFEKPQYNFILINNVQGAFTAARYLIRKRRAQPGYLRSAYPISNFEQRADGFYKAMDRGSPLSGSLEE